jgi:hypothetical protein
MLLNIDTISTSEAIHIIKQACLVQGLGYDGSFSGLPVMLLGEAGCGKSFAPMQAAKELGYQFREIAAMHYSPTDAVGPRTIPLDGSDYVKHYLPEWVKGLDRNLPAVLCFDEITKPPVAVINALLQVFQTRKAGDFELGPDWTIVLTGNTAAAKAGDRDTPSPLRSRVATYLVQNTCKQWIDNYAVPNNLHYSVVSFIQAHANSEQFDKYPSGPLNTWDGKENPAAYSCERALTNLATVAASGADARLFARALVGNEVGGLYCQHVDMLEQIPDIDLIKTDPRNAHVPDDIGICYYTGNMVSYWADRSTMDAIATYLRRMPAECAVMAMTQIATAHPECKETRAYIDFRLEYKLSI